MPSRVIRGEINSSRSLERVSMLADLTFRALILAVDDFGRIDGRLHILRAAIFPSRPEVTDKKLDGWLAELEREGCVLRYVVDGSEYLCLPNWSKHVAGGRKANKSRCPEPHSDTSQEILGNPRKSSASVLSPLSVASSEKRVASSEKSDRPPAEVVVEEEDPQAIAFASDFRTALLRVHDGFKTPTEAAFAKWCRSARLLLAERPEAEARALARWLFDATSQSEGAAFWRGVVLSVPKFREKFDQLAVRRRQEDQRGHQERVNGNGPGTSPLAERARAYLRTSGGRADAGA